MSVRAFLDTNIIIYSYSQDELEKQQCARACVQNKDVWISTQVLNETINTLRRKFSLSYVQIRAVVDELTQQFQIALVRFCITRNDRNFVTSLGAIVIGT
jgi:predicted nucleic acid-binding protein